MFVDKTQNIGEELFTPILSIFEVILQMNATNSINLEPLFFSRFFIGYRTSLLPFFTFSKYAPITISITPMYPNIFGNSPIIIGDKNNKNRLVKAINGTTLDISDICMDLKYNRKAKEFSKLPATNAYIKFFPKTGIPVKIITGERNSITKIKVIYNIK